MAYNFLAEKTVERELQILHGRLSEFKLIEFFPIEVTDRALVLGISIPMKVMDDPLLDDEVEKAMGYLVSEKGFQVTDLFTGKSIASDDIAGLTRRIKA